VNAGFRPLDGERTQINGLDAFVGTYQGNLEGLGNAGTLAAHVVLNNRVYLLAGIAPANQFNAAQAQFVNAIKSFRQLSAQEASNIRPNRVDLYTVRSGETWASLAERTGGLVNASTLAIMNGYEPNQPPRAGDRIKIITEG
jgi:predicted Zn-dependent protease